MDRTPTTESLLKHAAFVRGLAQHLLRDPAAEDDAVQETWRASLEHPPRGPVRAWLARVLRNRVYEEHRRSERRTARERAVARGEQVESVADAAARQEAVRTIAAAVLALEEPYRSTVLLRYYEDLAPRQIALRMDAPVETVKSRLKRARAQLRVALEARDRSWQLALLPLADMPSGLATSSILGAAIVSTTVKIAAVAVLVLLLGGAGWLLLHEPDEAVHELAREDGTARSAEGEQVPVLRPATPPAGKTPGAKFDVKLTIPTPGARKAAASKEKPKPTPGVVEGVVRIAEGDLRGGQVRLRTRGGTARAAEIQDDGSFRLDKLPTGGQTVVVQIPGRQMREIQVRVGVEGTQPIEVAFGTARLHGTVYDEHGRARPDVGVRLSTALQEQDDGSMRPSSAGSVFLTRTRTDAAGRYEFTGLPAGTFWIVGELASGEGSSLRNIRSFRVALGDGEERELHLGDPLEEGRWVGSVHYAHGKRIGRAGNIFMSHEDGTRRMYVRFDKEGRFAEDLPSGTWRMEFVLPTEDPNSGMPAYRCVPTAQQVVIEPGEVRTDAIIPGARIQGRVTGKRPGSARTPPQLLFERIGEAKDAPTPLIGKGGGPAKTFVGPDGAYQLEGLAPGRYRVKGRPYALDRDVELVVPAGEDAVALDLAWKR